eukprot:scaffold57640_cov74-Phaeocystis_antarctica.AAC.6
MLVDSLARATLCFFAALAEHLSKNLNMLPERNCVGALVGVLVDEKGPAVRVLDDGLASIKGDGHAARGEKGKQLH